MRFFRVFLAIAALGGLVSGPWALDAAAASNPPLHWQDISLMFVGCAASLPLILGLQAALGNDKAVRVGWHFFLLGAVNFFSTGISAAGVALASAAISPHSLLFLAMGSGLLVGVAVSRVLFGSKFAKAYTAGYGQDRTFPVVSQYIGRDPSWKLSTLSLTDGSCCGTATTCCST
ncbi:hypothetical protein QTI33_32030 [Variovorax sp. J22P271]|uniref:hypothetical protein n=1 Tax=Variovorax davisae TaxID=3053515 RepID=UPI002575B788|nr:hypothetical protein [Variovorax sp. J22P271]MDM0036802.1 hypothetical protein [Variovorax sp. J22P271]